MTDGIIHHFKKSVYFPKFVYFVYFHIFNQNQVTCYVYVYNDSSTSITTSFHLVKTLLQPIQFSCFKFHSIPSQNQHNQFILNQALDIIH